MCTESFDKNYNISPYSLCKKTLSLDIDLKILRHWRMYT